MTDPTNAGACKAIEREADRAAADMAVVLAALRGVMAGTPPQPDDRVMSAIEAVIERGHLAEFGRRALELVLQHRLAGLKARRLLITSTGVSPRGLH